MFSKKPYHDPLRGCLITIALGLMAGVFLVIVYFGWAFWDADPWNLRAPSDQELITLFKTKKDIFQRLVTITRENFDADGQDQPTILAAAEAQKRRDEEYDQLRNELGILMYTEPMHRWFPEKKVPVMFMFARGEATFFGDEWEKGIYFGPTQWDISGSKILQSLDGARKLPKAEYMRKIEDDWYLIYFRD